ncbi:MAG TPA: hydantoinase/oxoprolinase family protein [Thermoleophilaceae bacterium]
MNASNGSRDPRILAIDAGGTMTDTIVIDSQGDFVVGKAQTTPHDESEGFVASLEDACGYWELGVPDTVPQLVSGIYSGTAMINRLLERKGLRVGCIVTAGMEDYLRLERGIQTYLGYSYSDRVHVVTHRHNEPLVPRRWMKGATERVDVFGDVAIPLYEDEARTAARELLEEGVEAICINFVFSYRNPSHEERVEEIVREEMAAAGREVPVYRASDRYPLRPDFPRLNTLLVEAYAAEPSREHLQRVRRACRDQGAKFDLRIMASHGGTISVDARELAKTLISGPIGGVIGAGYLAERLGTDNVVCTDIGGTSFDLALITEGQHHIRNIPDVGRFLLNIPLVQIDSVGAGTGSFVRINPSSGRIEIGPDSAGSQIGVSWPEAGLDTPTITDCDLVLGYINPEYFLGGEITLDVDLARSVIGEQIASPLGLSVEEAAAGVVELFEDHLQNTVLGQVLGKGYSPLNYTLMSYGGGGPLHAAGYTRGLNFEDVLVPAWAAGFSAFGCACADFEYRYDRTVDVPLLPGTGDDAWQMVAGALNAAWDSLDDQVAGEFARNDVERDRIAFRPLVRMQYFGQLNDLELPSPVERIRSKEDVDALIDAFEELYAKVYARSARSPELGFMFTSAISLGAVDVEKPRLPESEERDEIPEGAQKGTRAIWADGQWVDAAIYEMERVAAGNVIEGPAVLEDPATTFVVPPGASARLDGNRIFHLRQQVATETFDELAAGASA